MSETTSVQYPKNWTHEAVQKYLTQESQQKSREEFEKTHVPIRRIKVTRNNNVPGFDDEYIDENRFRDGVLSSELHDDNRMFFVVGESGSGKSELCQWLQYQIEDQEQEDGFSHIPIHIPRQVREPREVLRRLEEYLDESKLDDARRLANLPPNGVFEKTIGTVTVAFDKGDPAVDLVEDSEFRETIRQNLREYVEAFDDPESELEFEPISQDQLADFLDSHPGVQEQYGQQGASATEELFDIITRHAKEAIKEMLYVGDLKETLRQINERFQERDERPVLIIEDLTGFTIFQHEILSFFSDLGASNWDVVIGVTTGMEQKLVEGRRADIASQDTINDRIAARVTLTEQTEEGSKTLFLEQEDVHIDLARTYLRAIKDESESGFTVEPGVSKDEIDDLFGQGLYPFNGRFLTRIYENLQEDDQRKQTPRVFLKFVIEGLLDSDKPPFYQAELLDTLGKVRCLVTADYDEPDQKILKWYGKEDSDSGIQRVDPGISETFGIESNGEAPLTTQSEDRCPDCGFPMDRTESGALVCTRCDTTCESCGAKMIQRNEFWVCTADESHQEPVGGKQGLFEDRLQELLDWRGDGAEFNKTSQIEDGAEKVIRFFYDQPTSLVRPECRSEKAAAFWWDKGGRKVPIHIDNGTNPDYRKVVIHPDLPESLLKDLLRLGIYDQSTVEEHIQNETVDAQQLRAWAEESVKGYRADLEKEVRAKFGADIDQIALFGKYLLNIFTGNGARFTAKALAQPVDLDDFSSSAKPQNLDFTMSKLGEYGETLIKLFHARFHLRSNMVDYERLQSQVHATSPAELCAEIMDMSQGIRGFKIGPTRADAMGLKEFLIEPSHFGFRTIVRSIYEYDDSKQYRDDLHEVKETFDQLQSFYEPVESPTELDWDVIVAAYDGLPSKFPPESVTKLREYDPDQTNDYEQALSGIESVALELEGVSSVWEFLSVYYQIASLKYGRTRDEFSHLQSLRSNLDDLDTALESRIEDLEQDLAIDIDTEEFDSCLSTARNLETQLEEFDD